MSKNRNWPDFRRKWNLTIRIFGFYRLMSKYARYSASEAPPPQKQKVSCSKLHHFFYFRKKQELLRCR